MQRQVEIIGYLADGRLHSGEQLARALGVSRASIWKHLRRAQEVLDIEVQSVRGKGYRLASRLELLDPRRIREGLSPAAAAYLKRIEVHVLLDSTNARLMRLADSNEPAGCLCLAERQTAGRGRHGRTWVSPFGHNIYLSLLWRYDLAPTELGGLSPAVGVGVARALQRLGVQGHGLKWPNDILWHQRKLSGLLLEVAGEAGGPSHVVIGVGINTRLSRAQGAAIDQPWTDLAAILGAHAFGRNAAVALVVDELLAVLLQFAEQGFAAFTEEWNRFDLLRGQQVEISIGSRRIGGRHVGIAADGGLLLQVGGQTRSFHAGEVSLRARR